MVGIYKITYLKDGRSYIGQSVNLEHRLSEHRHCEGESYIHNAIKKYGIENFSFEVIEECSIKDLDSREQYWIKFYNSYGSGFNLTPGGQGFYNQVKVDCFDFNGNRIATYDSIIEAEQVTGATKISDCLHGKKKSSGGYQWRIHNPLNDFIDIYDTYRVGNISISQFNLEGKFLKVFNSISEAAREVFNTDNGSLRRRIKRACEEDMGIADGFRWQYHTRSKIAAMADLLDG